MYATKPYRDAVKMQGLLMRDMEREGTKPIERAQLARAWEALEERKRILKMKPLPKPIDVSKDQGKQNRRPATNQFDQGISLSRPTPTTTHPAGGNSMAAPHSGTPTTESNSTGESEVAKVTEGGETTQVEEKPTSNIVQLQADSSSRSSEVIETSRQVSTRAGIIRKLPGVAAK